MDARKESFVFHCPTKIYFRPEGLSTIGAILADDYRYRKVVLVYGGHSLKSTGNLDVIEKSLKDHGVDFVSYGGVQANPDISDVRKIVELARGYKPDCLLACGGGSVIDCAKLASHAYYYDGNALDFVKRVSKPLHSLPLGVVLTLSASGSEMSDSCVISDRTTGFKGGLNDEHNYPTFSLLDPTLTKTVSDYQRAIGLVDMFSHSLERYCSPSSELEPCDDIALAVLRGIVKATPYVFAKDGNREEGDRAMMILGSLSHDGFTNYGKKKLFIIHAAEHKLSGKYPDLPHGQGIALLIPPYLHVNKDRLADKLRRLGKTVFDLDDPTPEEAIAALEKWLSSLPLVHRFEDLSVSIDEKDRETAENSLRLE